MSNKDVKVANSLNKHDVNKSVRTKIKKSVPKPVLCTPYKVEWPQVEQNVQEKVISYLKKFFKDNNLCLEPISKESLKNLKKSEKKAKLLEHKIKNKSSEIAKLRSRLAVGIQEVTRNLEQDNLSVIVVDRSSSWQLHRHLIQLSALRQCPAVAINQLSEVVSPLLALSRLCVLAVKKSKEGDTKIFQPLVDFVAPLCMKYEIPWLEAENQLMEIKNEHVNEITKALNAITQDSNDIIKVSKDITQDSNDIIIDSNDIIIDSNDNIKVSKENTQDSNAITKDLNDIKDSSDVNKSGPMDEINGVGEKDDNEMEVDDDDDDNKNDKHTEECNPDHGNIETEDDEQMENLEELPPYTDLYINVGDADESRLVCEIIDVDDDDLWNYDITILKERKTRKDDKFMIFSHPTNDNSGKRFLSAEVKKVQKNEFKKRKLN